MKLSIMSTNLFYFEGSLCRLPLAFQLFSADLTQLRTDHQAHRQPLSLLTQCLTSSPFTPRSSIQQLTHTPPVNPPRHHRTEMAKTAIGEFCTQYKCIYIFFFFFRYRRFEDAERLWRHPWHKRMLRVDERERPNSVK